MPVGLPLEKGDQLLSSNGTSFIAATAPLACALLQAYMGAHKDRGQDHRLCFRRYRPREKSGVEEDARSFISYPNLKQHTAAPDEPPRKKAKNNQATPPTSTAGGAAPDAAAAAAPEPVLPTPRPADAARPTVLSLSGNEARHAAGYAKAKHDRHQLGLTPWSEKLYKTKEKRRDALDARLLCNHVNSAHGAFLAGSNETDGGRCAPPEPRQMPAL
jgi:hypothetical protein